MVIKKPVALRRDACVRWCMAQAPRGGRSVQRKSMHWFVRRVVPIPFILHPPRRITVCLEQILRLAEDFPRLRVCLAHLSLTKRMVPGLEEAFRAIAQHPLMSFDTSLVPS